MDPIAVSRLQRAWGGIVGRWLRPKRDKRDITSDAGASGDSPPPALQPDDDRIPARQAVLLIHGMGEQIPMDTIKGFVSTVWESDPLITAIDLPNPNRVWSKPDDRTGSLELRRITTRLSIPGGAYPKGVRTDFYELYWADLTAGSTWDQVTGWVRHLLLRRWKDVPTDLHGAWIALWALALLGLAFAGLTLVPGDVWKSHMPTYLKQWLVVPAAVAIGALVQRISTRTFGRVVRYTRADPDNIASRRLVRERGLELLRALHRDRNYSRVVVVGHSLGTILAHDLISYFWNERSTAYAVHEGTPEFHAVADVERTAAALKTTDDDVGRAAFVAAQARLRRAMAGRDISPGKPAWLISDLVTIGSPLAHADVLLANDAADLADRIRSRELPACPPYREELDTKTLEAALAAGDLPLAANPKDSRLMIYPDPLSPGRWLLHHAAPFALVRWTNLFDPSRKLIYGDIVSGPLRPKFGFGIVDVDWSKKGGRSRKFTHTLYWSPDQAPERIEALRQAINLLDE